jgi:glycosyltransferase involved in cell wall biosynthesis
VRLAVVGPFPDPRERAAAERLAARVGIASRAEFTGRSTRVFSSDWMSRATVAVQLRSRSNGETPAALMECLAAGLPTITTCIGSAAELPDDCVVKVDAMHQR